MPRLRRASLAAAYGVAAYGAAAYGATHAAACARAATPSAAASPATAPSAVPEAVDHVILAIDSLERGVALLREATGLTATYGGAHPGNGTQNALLSVGGGRYLELLAPNPADSAAAAAPGAAERARTFAAHRRLTPVGWAVRVGDADSARAAYVARGLPAGPVRPGSRARPNGTTLAWRTVAPWGPLAAAHPRALPFAIEWGRATPHPAADAPGGCTLASFAVVSPAADSVGALLARAGLPTVVRRGDREHVQFALDCPRGRVAFP
jgi:hypothetical protein